MHARYLHAIVDVRYAHALRPCIARVRRANAHECIMCVLWHCLCVVDSIRAHGYTHGKIFVRIHQVNGLGRRHFAPISYAQAYSHVL